MDRFDQLAASYLDGALTLAQTDELAGLLRSDPQRMKEFLDGFEIDRLLAERRHGADLLAVGVNGDYLGDTPTLWRTQVP